MAKASPLQASFNGGELSPLLGGRVDFDKYGSGCSVLENFIPTVQGPIIKRAGTYWLNNVKDSAERIWFLRFMSSATAAYAVEVGDRYMRFYTGGARVVTGSVTAWSNATAYAVGDLAAQAGVNYYCITAHTNQTPPNATYWYALTGSVYEIPTPYLLADLTGSDGGFALKYAQVGDVVYIAHPSYALRKLSRYSETRWILETVSLLGGPFADNNETAVTLTAAAQTGTGVTFTASVATFNANLVGSSIRIERASVDDTLQWEVGKSITSGDRRRSFGVNYEALNTATTGTIRPSHLEGAAYDGNAGVQWDYRDPGYGYGDIASYISTTKITVDIVDRLPVGAVTPTTTTNWSLSLFSDDAGHPEHVTFFRGRMVLVKGQTICLSVVEDFENFATRDAAGTLTDEQAIIATISSDMSNAVQWIVPTTRGLMIGTASEEMIVSEMSSGAVLSATNLKNEPQTNVGSRAVQPAKIGDSAVFLQRSGKRLRKIGYSWEADGYRSGDMSALHPTVCSPGIIDMAHQQEPYSVLWMVRSDGQLIGVTIESEQQVECFHRHLLGGTDAVVESITAIPSAGNDRDELYLSVSRTIDGGTVRSVEVMQAEHSDGDDADDSFYVDCGITYDGVATATITGLDHLEGETVSVLADGAVHPDCTVSSGSITLQLTASVVHVGLPYTAKVRTMRLEAGAADGTAQGKTKRIHNVTFRFLQTSHGKFGPDNSNLDEMVFRTASDLMGAPVPLRDIDKFQPWPGGYDSDAYVMYASDKPLPATLVAIIPQVVTQDRG